MALSIKAIVEPVNRLLERVHPGAKLPANIRDDNAAEMLLLIVDTILPKSSDEPDPEDITRLPMVNGDTNVELGASMRSGKGKRPRQPTRAEIAQAKCEMLSALRKC